MEKSSRSLSGLIFLVCLLGGLPGVLFGEPDTSWQTPRTDYELRFPHDHGSHPEFRIEWWYLTGHLFAGERRFGFQATFFRLGQRPEMPTDQPFESAHLYLAHMALSDPETGRFFHEERFNRQGWDADAEIGRLHVFNGNWSLTMQEDSEQMSLVGSVESDVILGLNLNPTQPHVVFGEEGISRKGPEGTAASYYITFPRIEVSGQIRLDREKLDVTGQAWMDHEISSSQLDRGQVGWDWACFQFDDGREIMGYVLRQDDGTPSPYSKLVWISRDNELTHLSLDRYTWHHEGKWLSSDTNAEYPISPRIEVWDPELGKQRELKLIPILPNQEIVGKGGGVSYWEGACDIVEDDEIVGKAFLEMTGYADNIAERLQ
ncbi:MAG: carotenoid 1,2-hydratase [Verrucomicrobiota bacterium]